MIPCPSPIESPWLNPIEFNAGCLIPH